MDGLPHLCSELVFLIGFYIYVCITGAIWTLLLFYVHCPYLELRVSRPFIKLESHWRVIHSPHMTALNRTQQIQVASDRN